MAHAIQPRFTLDEREGTVTGPAGTVRLEPRVMEVLTVLAGQQGHVVPRDELLDTVWPGVVVTEFTLNRCIYRLRRALGGVAGDGGGDGADLIETLPKRGYRLLADIGRQPAPDVAVEPVEVPRSIPYVVGQWVRGERFYGRNSQIAELLHGQRDLVWLLGTRRVGKTSLLKQIELVSAAGPEPQFFALYWDLQGVDTAAEMHLNFNDALLDADDRLAVIGIDVHEITADDLFVSLDALRRQLRERGLNLLLLCDEVEELLALHRDQPSLLRKLRHALQSRGGIRTVLASTMRLWALADQTDDTSPFLHGFTPPVYIDRLTDDEARSLVRQSHLPADERPDLDEQSMARILDCCDNHPYLLQLVCKRFAECGDLDEAIEQVATDRMVSYFFSVDFDMLSESDRSIVNVIAGTPPVSRDEIAERVSVAPDALDGALRELVNLRFIRRDDGGYGIANDFFGRWLEGRAVADPVEVVAAAPVSMADDSRSSILQELKRRKVFRAGIAYIVVAWILLQLGDIVFDMLEVPGWAGRLLLVLLALGLPVALLLAWAFELTPEGLRRETQIGHDGNDAQKL